jgi:hypothetical protein
MEDPMQPGATLLVDCVIVSTVVTVLTTTRLRDYFGYFNIEELESMNFKFNVSFCHSDHRSILIVRLFRLFVQFGVAEVNANKNGKEIIQRNHAKIRDAECREC